MLPGRNTLAVPPGSKPLFHVNVRDLVEFVWRTGDLGSDGDFRGPERALAGIRGHQKIQRSRPADYEKEVPVVHLVETAEFTVRVEGRVDGLQRSGSTLLIEEIKTVQNGWSGEADPLHWAQLRIYAHILSLEHAEREIHLLLTYLNLDSGEIREFREEPSAADLKDFFQSTTAAYLAWLREHFARVQERDGSIRPLAFPFTQYRPGQRELAVAAYRTLARGGRLFVEAPTGIGKTISVLFPAVKALGEGKAERLFYLTARTTGRTVAEKALADMRRGGLVLRSLTLTAKEKMCVQEGKACDATTCPLARGYYDRRRPAMREALKQLEITRPVLDDLAQRHQVCPFELSLDLSTWVDAVVCDYNYLFDPKAYLRRHFGGAGGDYLFLIDEAHNLVDRGRKMFSADLAAEEIREVRRALAKAVPKCARALSKLSGELRRLGREDRGDRQEEDAAPLPERDLFAASHGEPVSPTTETVVAKLTRDGTQVLKTAPAGLGDLVDSALTQAEAWLARNEPSDFREALLQLYFRLFSFRRTLEDYDERFVTLIRGGNLQLFCLDPSKLLAQALDRGKAAVFFSATLTPLEYFRDLLGGQAGDPLLRLKSPFPSDHLSVLVHERIQTRFKSRAATLPEVAESIAALVEGRRGNYLVYLPSYEYLRTVLEQFQLRCPATRVLAQRPAMTDAEREDFLAAFAVDHSETLVGFAVMGGVFGEGIDLVGERLIGAVIVGVGLPQLCAERDLISEFFQEQRGAGFDYAYTYPGMNRVLQAVGRLIRSETDRGVALLLDTRFGERRYRDLFPAWWQLERVRSSQDAGAAVARFWQQKTEAVG